MNLYSIIEAGGRVKLEVTAEDLVKFAEKLIEKPRELNAHKQQSQGNGEETWLTAEEAAKLCHVSPGTLASWAKAGYLVPSKMGRRRLYAKSDIDRILRKLLAMNDTVCMVMIRATPTPHPPASLLTLFPLITSRIQMSGRSCLHCPCPSDGLAVRQTRQDTGPSLPSVSRLDLNRQQNIQDSSFCPAWLTGPYRAREHPKDSFNHYTPIHYEKIKL